MFMWYCPFDGKTELFDMNPCEHACKFDPGESIMMVPPVGWDCE